MWLCGVGSICACFIDRTGGRKCQPLFFIGDFERLAEVGKNWVLQGVRLAGKRDSNEYGIQEWMELFSGISKEQDFLGRLQDELPLF